VNGGDAVGDDPFRDDIPIDEPFPQGEAVTDNLKEQDNSVPPMGEEKVRDQVDTGIAPENVDMTEQILQDLEKQVKKKEGMIEGVSTQYISPPDYEYSGRGLVYNCLGKHWACVDAPSFRICQQNYNALKSQSRPKECYPDSVYSAEESCAWVQKKKITTNAKNDFCN
jgi:hypothetical protein